MAYAETYGEAAPVLEVQAQCGDSTALRREEASYLPMIPPGCHLLPHLIGLIPCAPHTNLRVRGRKERQTESASMLLW